MDVSDEAVEAAMRAGFLRHDWEDPHWRSVIERALEAAAPHLMAADQAALARAVESEVRAWDIITRLYDITPPGYKLGDEMESAIARALAHLGELRAATKGDAL